MQQLLNWMRRLVYPAAVILLLWAGYQVIAGPYISESNGKILVVYDGDSTVTNCDEEKKTTPDKENVSEEALAGFCRALPKHGPEVDLLNIHHDEVNYQSKLETTRIYQQLASRAAGGSVLGVISFLTSPDSPPVVRFCRTMQIPLLIAVAANDDLMARAEDTRGIVFRMMPTNGRQAVDIATWLGEQKPAHGKRLRVAVFHEQNPFGEFLQRQLNDKLQPKTRDNEVILYNFEVTEQMQFADLMPQLWCENLDMIVYLGFASRAMDLLNKLRWYRADRDQVACRPADTSRSFEHETVLLSSGAYEEDLNDPEKYQFPFKVFAMLPTPLAAKKDGEETGAYEYGYDSYAVLEGLAEQRFRIPSQSIGSSKTKTGHDYCFDAHGELTPADKNRYQAYPLASYVPARKP